MKLLPLPRGFGMSIADSSNSLIVRENRRSVKITTLDRRPATGQCVAIPQSGATAVRGPRFSPQIAGQSTLFVPERFERIGERGATRGDITGQRGHRREYQDNAADGPRIVRAHSEQQAAEDSAGTERHRDANH